MVLGRGHHFFREGSTTTTTGTTPTTPTRKRQKEQPTAPATTEHNHGNYSSLWLRVEAAASAPVVAVVLAAVFRRSWW